MAGTPAGRSHLSRGGEAVAHLRPHLRRHPAAQRRAQHCGADLVLLRGGQDFFTTSPTSWKAKRIARGSPLFINVGSADGPALVGKAEPVDDAALIDRMGEEYAKKYWIAWAGFFKPRSDRVRSGKTRAYLVTITG